MATRARKLEVGAFVLTALIVAFAGLVWLGATRFLQRTERYTTYFGESVQGIEPGAPVKYRGVQVGRVHDLDIAPDPALIEVVMSIDADFVPIVDADPTLRAGIALQGLTGIRYIELARREGDPLRRHPELHFEAPYPVIPSAPSTIVEVAEALEQLYESFKEADLPGLSAEMRRALQVSQELMRDPRLSATLTNLESTTRTVDALASDLQRITGAGRVEAVLSNLEVASADAREITAGIKGQTATADLQRAIHGWVQLAENGQALMGEVQLTVERLDVAAGEVEASTRGVREQPSLLLFSKRPEPREPGRGR